MKLDKIQEGAVEFLRRQDKALICLGVGVGKSAVVIKHLYDHPFAKAVLVVPKSISVRWSNATAGLPNVKVCTFGKIADFAEDLHSAAIVVIDEPKLLKNEANQVHRLLVDIAASAAPTQQRILLDATPVECRIGEELAAIAAWMGFDDPARLLRCMYPPADYTHKPPRPRKVKRVKIPIPEAQTAIVKFAELEVSKYLYPHIRSVLHVNAAIGRLIRAMTGFDKGELGPVKLNVLMDLLKAKHREDAGVICVTRKDAMKAICDRLNAEGFKAMTFHGELSAKKRQEVVDKFEAEDVKWVVATKSGERGLNLRKGSVVVHFDLAWAGSSFTQRDRVTRRDSDLSKTTIVYVLLFNDSAEELIYDRVKTRIKMNEDFNEGIIKERFGESWTSWLKSKWKRLYDINLEDLK
ncbi:MAG: DEAD/DEAH box helicase [Candidatus Omnitrophica bacterium]|nr:DEAD/DEAH box helicase [Candidatus Omnitrophota bacterium]